MRHSVRLNVRLSVCVSGSLATSVFDSDAVLVGASGGVYALIAAHLPSVFLVSRRPRRHSHVLHIFDVPVVTAASVRRRF